MTGSSVAEQEEMIERVLRKNAATLHLARVPRTPLEELIGKEEEEGGDAWEERVKVLRLMLDYIFQDGPDPLKVLRFIFALAKAVRPEVLGDMSLADISIICADGGKATVSARIQRIYNKKLEAAGAVGVAAAFQKRGNYSAAQMGNSNRTGGTKKKSKISKSRRTSNKKVKS